MKTPKVITRDDRQSLIREMDAHGGPNPGERYVDAIIRLMGMGAEVTGDLEKIGEIPESVIIPGPFRQGP